MVLAKSLYALTGMFLVVSTLQAHATPVSQYHQCNKEFTYQLFFNNHKIGTLTRKLNWKNNQASINTYSHVDVYVTESKFNQKSNVYWSDKHQSFLTRSFSRNVSGLMSEKVSATFEADGKKSTVTNDGETLNFNSEDLPLIDVDAIGTQMRHAIISGKKEFDFKMQSTDEVSHYYFAVKGEETINTNFGKQQTIRVEQVKKSDRKFILWFAPDVDYQLIRATYKRKILNLKTMLYSKSIKCS